MGPFSTLHCVVAFSHTYTFFLFSLRLLSQKRRCIVCGESTPILAFVYDMLFDGIPSEASVEKVLNMIALVAALVLVWLYPNPRWPRHLDSLRRPGGCIWTVELLPLWVCPPRGFHTYQHGNHRKW